MSEDVPFQLQLMKDQNINYHADIKRLISDVEWKQIFSNEDNKKFQYREDFLINLRESKLDTIRFKQLTHDNWPSLLHLDLAFIKFGSKGAKNLSKSSMLQLQMLRIETCYIHNQGAIHLVKANWPNLINFLACNQQYIIYLGGNKIGQDGFEKLLENNWKKLKQFSVAAEHLLTHIKAAALLGKNIFITQSIQNWDLFELVIIIGRNKNNEI